MKEPKYYTTFLLAGYDPKDLHCTHKYLGAQTPGDLEAIKGILDGFFQAPHKFPVLRFEVPRLFGPNRSIRVLSPRRFDPPTLFPKLREMLQHFRKDDYDDYTPHVTHATLEVVDLTIVGYALMQGDKVCAQWPKRKGAE